jgi:outer membrane immunogenic protein
MRTFTLAGAAIAAMLAGPAMAADMPMKAPPPPVLLYDWSGLYVGASIGGIWYQENQFYSFNNLGNHSTSDSDGIFGMHAGLQGQWGNWVLGLEFGYSSCFRECRALSGILPSPPFAANLATENKLTQLATIGPRLGWAWDRFMIYGTGGWASANLKSSYCLTNVQVVGVACGPGIGAGFPLTQNGASWNQGWFAGGGFEWMVHRGALVDVVLGVEYQHFDVSNKRDHANCGALACFAANQFDYDLDAKGDLVRARLTIKTQGYGIFGAVGKAPVAAPYPTK